MEDDVTMTQKIWNPGKQKPYTEYSQTLNKKITWTKIPPHFGFPPAISILRRKVCQSPSNTRWPKPEIMRSTA